MKKSNNIISDLTKNIPLETRLKVDIQAFFIDEYGGSFFIEHNENGEEIKNHNNVLAFEKAHPLIKTIMETIKEWKEDGCP